MARVAYLQGNPAGSDWVCGDIHGEFSLLEEKLRGAGFHHGRDRLFCTGDLIDRGPESERALEFLRYPWFHSVLGNHDDFLLHHDDPHTRMVWLFNGGQWWNRVSAACRREFVNAFRQLPLAITVDTPLGPVGILHGEVPAEDAWGAFLARLERDEPAALESALWGRGRWMRRDRGGVRGLHRLYCGHTVVEPGSASLGNVVFVDTGAAFFGTLTLLRFSGPADR